MHSANGALEGGYGVGRAVSLKWAGDGWAVGGPLACGATNANSNAVAVSLFTFSASSFSGFALAATLGSGYTGGKNVNVALDSSDGFGSAVSLNAAGDRLAVGAPFDGGATNANSNSGAVSLFTFSAETLSGFALASTVGWGSTCGQNTNAQRDGG